MTRDEPISGWSVLDKPSSPHSYQPGWVRYRSLPTRSAVDASSSVVGGASGALTCSLPQHAWPAAQHRRANCMSATRNLHRRSETTWSAPTRLAGPMLDSWLPQHQRGCVPWLVTTCQSSRGRRCCPCFRGRARVSSGGYDESMYFSGQSHRRVVLATSRHLPRDLNSRERFPPSRVPDNRNPAIDTTQTG